MKIVRLTAENVKRLRAVEITPDGNIQVITGRNAQGKTSVLDAIWLALGGGSASKGTVKPIRDGEEKASVCLDLGDLVITRTWTGDRTALKVESADGAKFSSPQGILDSLVGRLSFDPLEFTRLSARDQVAALLDLVNLDIDLPAVAAQRQRTYDERTEIGRQGKALAGQVDGLGKREDAPDAEVSVSALLTQYREADEQHRAHRSTYNAAAILENDIEAANAQILTIKTLIESKTIALRAAEKSLSKTTDLPDLDAIQGQIDGAEETNAAVRRNATRASLAADLDATRAKFTKATHDIEAIDKTKADALAGATFPVDGLGFDDDGVTYRGVPFSQASSAEQIRVSLAMAMSLNPKLRVIRILDGSLLDAENMALIAEMAKDKDYQVWIERVSDPSETAVVIEDGAVI